MTAFLLIVLVLAFVTIVIRFGPLVAWEELRKERAELDVRRHVLDIEWETLDKVRRINDVFYQTRSALRRAALDDDVPPRGQ
jgi:hypothetical protein